MAIDEKREATRKWFRDAKFGLFIHWGLYSVRGEGEWLRSYKKVPEDEYRKQIPGFTAERFDAKAWARLARETGVKYMVITTKHHDGFCMFDAHNTDWKATNTPAGRDLIRELVDAFEAEGIKVGFYYSIMDWHHPDYLPRMEFEAASRPSEGHNVMDYIAYMREQLHQLMTEYGDAPFVLWYDGGWMNAPEELGAAETNALARKWHPGLLINDRHHTKEDLITPEQRVPATGILDDNGEPALWEGCMTMTSYWWGYDRNETKFKSRGFILRTLIDMVSKGGNYLLNIGPRADGTIQREFTDRLRYIGKWMKKYGGAIYGTTASPFNRLPFYGRVTVSGDTLNVFVFAWPKEGHICLPNLKNNIISAHLMGRSHALEVFRRSGQWHIKLPKTPPDECASVVVVKLDGAPDVSPVEITANAKGDIPLPVLYGDLTGPHGQRIRYEVHEGRAVVCGWYRGPDRISWTFELPEGGEYALRIRYYAANGEPGLNYHVFVNPEKRPAFAPNGKPWSAEDAKKLFITEPEFEFATEPTNGRYRNFVVGTLRLAKGTNVVSIVLNHVTDMQTLFESNEEPKCGIRLASAVLLKK